MNAINHAATALLINSKWPGTPLVPVLLCVQLVECLWVLFNLGGLEFVTTEPKVTAISDIHFFHMAYSHSIASTLLIALLVWFVTSKIFKNPDWALALAVAVLSHLVLDLFTHVEDIPLAPGYSSLKFGTGLYDIPVLALVVETAYGVWCWWIFRGSKILLAVILLFNIGTISFYSHQISGPEILLAGHSQIFAAVIGLHTVAGAIAIWLFARKDWRHNALEVQRRTMEASAAAHKWFT